MPYVVHAAATNQPSRCPLTGRLPRGCDRAARFGKRADSAPTVPERPALRYDRREAFATRCRRGLAVASRRRALEQTLEMQGYMTAHKPMSESWHDLKCDCELAVARATTSKP